MSHIRTYSVHLHVREPTAGVTLDAYVKCSGGSGFPNKTIDEDGTNRSTDSSGDQTLLRYRWYRAADTEQPVQSTLHCHVHPSRPAAFYCGFWKAELSAFGYIFPHACHCSLRCFQEHFHLQRRFWEKACNARRQTTESALSYWILWPTPGPDAGVNRAVCSGSSSLPVPRTALCIPDADDGWVLVGTAENYTPCELDVGHCLQLRVSVRLCNG